MSIVVKSVSKKFKNNFVALDNVTLKVEPGELVALLGPSGSGKTTLLRIISGLEFPDFGSVILDGKEAHDQSVKERNVGFVFQHYALFKHMTVFENVAFGLSVKPKKERLSKEEIQEKVLSLLKLVHLDAFHDRYPSQLSGGQRQRVALARALAVEPKVLLLDEPFGALDAKVRKELRRWMRKLHDEIHITSVFVTHDQEEAMEVADKIVVMNKGRIEQVGSPEEVYNNPANSFVYDFLGNYNEFTGWKDDEGNIHFLDSEVKKSTIVIEESTTKNIIDFISKKVFGKKEDEIIVETKIASKPKPKNIKEIKIYCRPHELFVSKIKAPEEYIKAKITHINKAGSMIKLEMEDKAGKLLFAEIGRQVQEDENFNKGDEVYLYPKNIKIFNQ
ncbi:MAG: sulfate ABC transporter ATP-binding protein [Rickettsiales bacterium]|nr:sulfate ABC transporter ATP-binding protein [Rickettsiales bacterium]